MIWLRLRALFAQHHLPVFVRRMLWGVIAISIVGTVSVETPFLLHLAGTSDWQRLVVLALGLGVIAVNALILLLRRCSLSPTQACVVGLETAYLANATLCLVVYSGARGDIRSRSGWLVTMVVIWPIALELVWLLFQCFRVEAAQTDLSIVRLDWDCGWLTGIPEPSGNWVETSVMPTTRPRSVNASYSPVLAMPVFRGQPVFSLYFSSRVRA